MEAVVEGVVDAEFESDAIEKFLERSNDIEIVYTSPQDQNLKQLLFFLHF